MEVSNDTDQDTKYKVSGGGVPIPQDPKLNTSTWPVLTKKTKTKHSPKLPGPWWISFAVNGKHVGVGQASTADDRVTLKKVGRKYQVEVCRLF